MIRALIVGESAIQADMLRTLFLFEALPDEHLESLAGNGVLVDFETGLVFSEGEAPCYFYVLVDGELSLSKRSGDRDVETMRTSHPGAYCGATASFIEHPPDAYGFSVRATRPSRMVRIRGDYFGDFVRTHYPMAVHLLQGMHVDHESVHQVIDQQRRIQAAGTLTAGLMHGLNNPAGAIARIASQLRSRQQADRQAQAYGRLSSTAAAAYDLFKTEATEAVQIAGTSTAPALQRIHREERIDDWLTAHGIEQSWEVAPVLAAGGLSDSWLQGVAEALERTDSGGQLDAVVAALTERVDTLLLLDELSGASAEVSALVASAQKYSRLDREPLAQGNINDMLDSTLTVMSGALDERVIIHRDYADDLPALLCYAGELNQAWTNIIDNATDAIRAMNGHSGKIAVRTSLLDAGVIRVEISDNGIGIDPLIRDRIFLPFFTTKPVGQGIGMGLDLAWRTIVGLHHGSLSVTSKPGDTRFTACLPIRGCQPSG